MSTLKVNQSIRLINGSTAVVQKELGRGGQGIVYLVEISGKKMALKWYLKHPGQAFYKNLSDNVASGAPAPNFIWPLAITEEFDGSFGYVMELRPSGFEDMNQFILTHARFKDVHTQLKACLQICTAFQKLHIRGLSYQDMNDGNFFINPDTGDVMICDNDNVAPDGTNMGVLGKAGYMAPEIVEGTKMPGRYTDYYSLAVCLFILIYMNRPFEGQWYLSCPCDNHPAMAKKLFGFSSVFIMDPLNKKNRPVPGIHNNVIRRWNVFPEFLGRQFCRTFSSEAIQDPTKRLMDKQWYNIILQVRTMYAKCPDCGKETFIDISQKSPRCIFCRAPLAVSALKVGRFTIPLVDTLPIYACLVSSETNNNVIIGKTIKRGDMIGLENTSSISWTAILPDGSCRVVNKGESMPAKKGLKVKFGQGETGEFI